MSSNFPELEFSEDEDFTADRLNRAMQVLDQRLRSLEPFTPSWEAAVNDLRAVGLSRLNDAILPAYEKVQLLATMGFLTAGSSTSLTLVLNQDKIFTINNLTERSLFTPGPFLAITRASTTADYAIAQLVSYDRTTGDLRATIKAITGSPGPFTDWQISAVAGSVLSAMAYLTQIEAAKATAVAAQVTASANAVSTAADKVTTTADAASALASKIAAAASAAAAATWDPSSYYTKTTIDTKFSNLVNGAGASLDTLNELAAALGNDANYSATITAALGNRVRTDTAAQGLDATQKSNARTNIGVIAGTATGTFAAGDDSRITGAVQKAGNQTITGGYALTIANLGNSSGLTVTINPLIGNYQFIVNNGAFTIAAPTVDCAVDLLVSTAPGAGGSITFSGFYASTSFGTGDPLTSAAGYFTLISIRRIAAIATYTIKRING